MTGQSKMVTFLIVAIALMFGPNVGLAVSWPIVAYQPAWAQVRT